MNEQATAPLDPQTIPGLICLWDFQVRGGGRLTSRGAVSYTLQEMNGPIAVAEGGVLGPHCLRIRRTQWLRIPRRDCPALNLFGRRNLTVVAWVQRQVDNEWQYIAGMWDERRACRQYALFTSGHKQAHPDLTRTDARHQPHGYVSDVGGATPGHPYCFSYATGARRVEAGTWMMLAFTYDQAAIRVYVNGELDSNGGCNPFPWTQEIYDGGAEGADFTIAQRAVPSWPGYPLGAPEREVGFGGLLGGVAVCGEALDAATIARLARQTGF